MDSGLLMHFGASIGYACSKGFFGLIPWDYYLPSTDLDSGSCSIRHFHLFAGGGHAADLPLILIAVVDDLLRIAGLVAIAFVIVGAIRYTTSQGNPDDTARAQSTVINALIGVALATVAVGIVSFLGAQLGGPNTPPVAVHPHQISPGGLPQAAANSDTLQHVLQIVFGIVGALAFLMIVISGFRYVLSAGNPDRTSRAKNGIIYALVGIVIALTAEALVTYVVNQS